MSDLALRCECGTVTGVAEHVTRRSSNRLVCYCSDCQAFANRLGASARVLNEHGGTEIFQVAPSRVKVLQGHDQIACLKLSEKGPFRWYAKCCNTPIGNTMKPEVPFIGLISAFIDMEAADQDPQIGPAQCHCQTQYALESWPSDQKRTGFPVGFTIRMMVFIMGWKMRGLGKENPFFTSAGDPIAASKQDAPKQ
ncbi:MAG: DUF6151 family protein [Paracoccaceae bacterium]